MQNNSEDFSKIRGTLVYAQIDVPGHGYKDPISGVQNEDEWKISVVLTDEDYVDDFKANAVKNKWKMSGVKEIRVGEFEEKYKCSLPELTDPKQKKVWLITAKKSTKLGKAGIEVPEIYRPKVYQKIKNTLLDITHDQEKIIGNGSEGVVSFSFFERTNGNTQVSLKNVLVTKLIPYERAASVPNTGEEFDDVDVPEAKFTDKAPAKAAVKPKVTKAETSIDDDDLPF